MELTLLDQNLELVEQPLDGFESLRYSDTWDDTGSMSLVVPRRTAERMRAARYVYIDDEHSYEIVTMKDATIQGRHSLKIVGASLDVLLDYITVYDEERLIGNLEEIVRQLITKYAMSGSQKIAKLALQPLQGYKRACDITTERGPLGKQLRSELNSRGFSYRIIYKLETDELVFELLKGENRTQDQYKNEPVLLSSGDGSLENTEYEYTRKDHRNFAYVIDDSDSANVKIIEVDQRRGGEPARTIKVMGSVSSATSEDTTVDMFVMVGRDGKAATSLDGKAFTSVTTGLTDHLWGVDYDGGKFLLCGSNGAISTSEDGTTYTPRASGVTVALEGAMWFDGLYFAVGNSGTMLYSYDQQTWYQLAAIGGKLVSPIVCGDNVFIMSSGTASSAVYITVDLNLDYAAAHYVFVSDETSFVSILASAASGNVIVGAGYCTKNSVYYPCFIRSEDFGVTWTSTVLWDQPGAHATDITYGNGKFCAVGQPDVIWYSVLGDTWTVAATSGTAIDYITVTHNRDNFYAYGYSVKYVAISADCVSWEKFTHNGLASYGIDAVIFGSSSETSGLRQQGVDALAKELEVEALNGDVVISLAPAYRVRYNIGDVIDVESSDHGITVAKRVMNVDFVKDKDTDSIVPKIGEGFLTLRRMIEREVAHNAV